MKKILFIPVIVITLFSATLGQKIAKPTLTPKPLTESQSKLIQQGTALHDAKKYDEAIAKYEEVLAQNPDSSNAIYELAMTLYTKGDKVKAMETANRGSKYISDELPLLYGVMASVLDDMGKPKEAVKIYHDAIKILEGDKQFTTYLSSLHYNLGVTYVQQKQYSEARQELKRAVAYDFKYASPHYLLSVVYNGTKYKVPAFLAASRFISLEYNTTRSRAAAGLIRDVLKSAPKDPKTGNINIFLNLDAPKDEGDFGMYELFLGTLTAVKDEKDKNKTENEMFVDAIGTLIALIDEDQKLKSTFVGKNYVPFVAEMKKKGYAEVFGYMVLYVSGTESAMTWLKANDAKLGEFLAWAKAYQLPTK